MKLNDEHIIWMATGLSQFPSLKELTLSHNNFTFEGALSLSSGLVL